MTFKEGQSPMKKLNLASLKAGIKNIGSKIKDKFANMSDEDKEKLRESVGDSLTAAGEKLSEYSPGEIDMSYTSASVPSQSEEIPDIENIVPGSTPITKKYKK